MEHAKLGASFLSCLHDFEERMPPTAVFMYLEKGLDLLASLEVVEPLPLLLLFLLFLLLLPFLGLLGPAAVALGLGVGVGVDGVRRGGAPGGLDRDGGVGDAGHGVECLWRRHERRRTGGTGKRKKRNMPRAWQAGKGPCGNR